MKPLLSTLLSGLCAASLLLAGSAAAEDAERDPDTHSGPRILWGQHGDGDYDFSSRTPLRRSDASTRQAYFGSGDEYSETLSRLQAQLQRMATRERFGNLELSPAQEAARAEMPPALLRALALSQGSTPRDPDRTEEN